MASVMTRVCVLAASYEESQGALKAVEGGYEVTPAHFFAPKWPPASHPDLSPDANPSKLSFDVLPVHKRTAYAQVREAVKSGKYDCFFNLCDGAKDEDRAGVEVVRALEEFGVAFTGSTSKHYEPTKDDMKKLVHYAGIRTPRGYVVRSPAQIQSKCASLRFPVIVKHASGYSSVGMTRLSKCEDMAALLSVASEFIEEYECALVEEFISGEEATVLACADPTAPGGVKVYPPVMMRFPKGEDFKHFDLKWNTFDDIAWYAMSPSHPAYQRVMEVGKVAFRQVMDGIGYGRSDVRIDAVTGDVVFLELNPNCGIMYPYGQEGSADWILRFAGASGQGHRDFITLQVSAAIARAESLRPCYEVVLDAARDTYVLEATRDIPQGRIVFEDEGRPTRLYTRDYILQHWSQKQMQVFSENAWPMGCDQHVYAVWDKEPDKWRPVCHSCDPNLRFVDGHSLNVEAARNIKAGDRLSMDYRTFMDSTMTPFACTCGAPACCGTILLDQNPGFLNGTEQGKLIRSFHRRDKTAAPLLAMLPVESASGSDATPRTSPREA
jgi:D-alanine-D-alanine ligase-like ATP-grasp enzyme